MKNACCISVMYFGWWSCCGDKNNKNPIVLEDNLQELKATAIFETIICLREMTILISINLLVVGQRNNECIFCVENIRKMLAISDIDIYCRIFVLWHLIGKGSKSRFLKCVTLKHLSRHRYLKWMLNTKVVGFHPLSLTDKGLLLS